MALTRINNNSLSAVTAAGIPMPTGAVIQTVRAFTDAHTTLSASTSTWQDVGFEAAITPSSTSSLILINLELVFRPTQVGGDNNFRMKYSTDGKSTSAIVNPSNNPVTNQSAAITGNTRGADPYGERLTYTTLHSPNTTNEVVYFLQYIGEAAMQLNKYTTSEFPRFGYTVSELILQEIAG